MRAQLLIEAADCLNEAQARDQRIEITNDIKKLKKDDIDYFKGKLSKQDGVKKYEEFKTAIDEFRTKIDSIPKETVGDRALTWLRFYTEPKNAITLFISVALSLGVSIFLSSLISKSGEAAAEDLFSKGKYYEAIDKRVDTKDTQDLIFKLGGIAVQGTSLGVRLKSAKTKNGEMHFNKAYAERQLDTLEKIVDKAYHKYYESND